MPTAIPRGYPSINLAPLFFCSPGEKSNCPPALKSSPTPTAAKPPSSLAQKCRGCDLTFDTKNKLFDHIRAYSDHQIDDPLISAGFDSPAPWPAGTQLRVKVLAGEQIDDEIVEIVKSAAGAWVDGLVDDSIALHWVASHESAELRISFRNDAPNWSALGTKANFYDQSRATMNFAFGGWGDKRLVFSHKQIRRAACHLFGHALGLPHARNQSTASWNAIELKKAYGSFFATVIEAAKGCDRLQSAQSIMAFDRPAALGSGTDEHRGGSVIDAEAKALLQTLYPRVPEVFSRDVWCSGVSGWSGGIDRPPAILRLDTKQTANVVTGICRIDMGLNGNFRLDSYAQNLQAGSGYNVVLGSWADTQICDATCAVLSFEEGDSRVQTGREKYSEMREKAGEAPRAGAGYKKRINFTRPFKQVPKVVTFLSGLDSIKGRNVRLEVSPSIVDCHGFTINLWTWDNTTVYDMIVSWLAHEPDEHSIRSGSFDNALHPDRILAETPTAAYSTPMRRKPKTVFRALSQMDLNASQHVRVDYQVLKWDEKSVDAKFSTWSEESKYFCLKGIYVAVM